MGKLSRSITRFFADTWTWESLALVFSGSCFVVIIALLLNYDDRVFPELPQGITLNAIVSLLANGSKAALLTAVGASFAQYKWLQLDGARKQRSLGELQALDDASRGPWGAMMLALRANTSVTLIIGIVVTIAALAFEAFVQQTISYRSEVIYRRSEAALMPVATTYVLDTRLSSTDQDLEFTETVLQQSFLGQDVTLPKAVPTCNSGNCTWEPYAVLGLCSHCVDITDHAKDDLLCDSDGVCKQYAIDGLDPYISFDPSDLLYLSSWVGVRINSKLSNWTARTDSKIADPLFAMESIKYSQRGVPSQAFECSMTFCARTRRASSINGRLLVEEIDIQYPIPDPTLLAPERAGDDWAVDFSPTTLKASNVKSRFKVDNSTASNLRFLLTDSYLAAYQTADTYYSSVLFDNEVSIDYSAVNLLFNTTKDLPMLMDRSALAFTDFMQNLSTSTVEGNAGILRTRVRVRWPWIAYPAAIMALGVMFLTSTVFTTRASKMMIWKTSVIAMLYHGLDVVPSDAGQLQEISQMDEHAEGIKARLGKTNDGWKILILGRRQKQNATRGTEVGDQANAGNSTPLPGTALPTSPPTNPPTLPPVAIQQPPTLSHPGAHPLTRP